VQFDWDDENINHLAWHTVEPDEVEAAFADPDRVAREAYNTPTERRRGIIAVTDDGRLLTVIYTVRRGMVPLVSAWDADERDARRYDRRRR
jgi:uncharacterized DUF497 family protein